MLVCERPEYCADRGFMRYFGGELQWHLVDFLVDLGTSGGRGEERAH